MAKEIHIHNHFIDTQLIISKLNTIMASNDQITAVLNRIEVAIGKLPDNTGGLNAEQEDSALGRLENIAALLEARVPPAPPVEPAPEG